MMTRTDDHRPSQLIPADYEELFPYSLPTSHDGWPVPGENVKAVMAIQAWADIHRGIGRCDCCGGHHIHGSVFVHTPTNQHIIMGWICAAKADFAMDASAHALLKGNRAEARKTAVEKARRAAFLKEFVRGVGPEVLKALKCQHRIVREIRSKIARYGISDPQIALVLKLAAQAEQDAETASPVVEGKIQITGEVVSAKYVDSFYGSTYKMLVRDDRGFKVFGTVPAAIDKNSDGVRGLRVTFTATVEKSDRDETFGFFKRPTKASVVV